MGAPSAAMLHGEAKVFRAGRGEGGVAALAANGDPAGFGRHQAGDAEHGAEPDRDLGGVLGGRAAADLLEVVPRQVRQGERDGLEVVEEPELSCAGRGEHLVVGERPAAVAHDVAVAGERAGHRDPRHLRPLRHRLEIGADGVLERGEEVAPKRGIVRDRQFVDVADGEAGMVAADVADECDAGVAAHRWPVLISGPRRQAYNAAPSVMPFSSPAARRH
jgi:hypothetical protein